MLFSTLHHVAIICSNYSLSKDFYTRVLGFEIINETIRYGNNGIKLDLKINDSEYLELFFIANSPARVSYPEACGLRHLAFAVEDINQVVKYLKDLGIATEEIRMDHLTNKLFTFFADPDGLPLEIYQLGSN